MINNKSAFSLHMITVNFFLHIYIIYKMKVAEELQDKTKAVTFHRVFFSGDYKLEILGSIFTK